MKLIIILICIFPAYISCRKSNVDSRHSTPPINEADNSKSPNVDTDNEYLRAKIMQMIAKKAISEFDTKSILNNLEEGGDSRLKDLKPEEKFDLLKILVNQMSDNSSEWDDTYRLLTSLQTMCLPNNKNVWQNWIEENSANSINWVF